MSAVSGRWLSSGDAPFAGVGVDVIASCIVV